MMGSSGAKPPKSPTSSSALLVTNMRGTRFSKSASRPVSMKRLRTLCNELKAKDQKSELPWRTLLMVFMAFVGFSVFHLVLTAFFHILSPQYMTLPSHSLYTRYDEIFYPDSEFAYIPEAKLFVTTTAKAGSTTFWTWLHRGVTGYSSFDECKYTEIQDFSAPCWNGAVVHPYNMKNEQRWQMLNSHRVLRVAITRNAFERTISAWKAKAACDSDDFGTDVKDRDVIIPILLKQAQVEKEATCLSLASFAEVLDKIRQRVEKGEFEFKDVNKNFRPQQLHLDIIRYDLVLDVADLTNESALNPIISRVKFPVLMEKVPHILRTSRTSFQALSEHTAALLYKYALLTPPFPTVQEKL